MYRRILAKVLAEDFVIGRNWSEARALELGKTVLRGNVERIFSV
jgi:glucuronate isomerase